MTFFLVNTRSVFRSYLIILALSLNIIGPRAKTLIDCGPCFVEKRKINICGFFKTVSI